MATIQPVSFSSWVEKIKEAQFKNEHKVKFIWVVNFIIKIERIRNVSLKIRTSSPIKVHTLNGYMILIMWDLNKKPLE